METYSGVQLLGFDQTHFSFDQRDREIRATKRAAPRPFPVQSALRPRRARGGRAERGLTIRAQIDSCHFHPTTRRPLTAPQDSVILPRLRNQRANSVATQEERYAFPTMLPSTTPGPIASAFHRAGTRRPLRFRPEGRRWTARKARQIQARRRCRRARHAVDDADYECVSISHAQRDKKAMKTLIINPERIETWVQPPSPTSSRRSHRHRS